MATSSNTDDLLLETCINSQNCYQADDTLTEKNKSDFSFNKKIIEMTTRIMVNTYHFIQIVEIISSKAIKTMIEMQFTSTKRLQIQLNKEYYEQLMNDTEKDYKKQMFKFLSKQLNYFKTEKNKAKKNQIQSTLSKNFNFNQNKTIFQEDYLNINSISNNTKKIRLLEDKEDGYIKTSLQADLQISNLMIYKPNFNDINYSKKIVKETPHLSPKAFAKIPCDSESFSPVTKEVGHKRSHTLLANDKHEKIKFFETNLHQILDNHRNITRDLSSSRNKIKYCLQSTKKKSRLDYQYLIFKSK